MYMSTQTWPMCLEQGLGTSVAECKPKLQQKGFCNHQIGIHYTCYAFTVTSLPILYPTLLE